MLAITKPRESWLAKWQKLAYFTPGVYCLKVFGELPEDIYADVENQKKNN